MEYKSYHIVHYIYIHQNTFTDAEDIMLKWMCDMKWCTNVDLFVRLCPIMSLILIIDTNQPQQRYAVVLAEAAWAVCVCVCVCVVLVALLCWRFSLLFHFYHRAVYCKKSVTCCVVVRSGVSLMEVHFYAVHVCKERFLFLQLPSYLSLCCKSTSVFWLRCSSAMVDYRLDYVLLFKML